MITVASYEGDDKGKQAVAQMAAFHAAQTQAAAAIAAGLNGRLEQMQMPRPPVPEGVDPNSPGYGPRVPR
jgi:hypothetical protein